MNSRDPVTRLNAALECRYRVERAPGEGGMATVGVLSYVEPCVWGATPDAIDGYLVSRPDAAAAACRKVLRHAPGVVRTHRTMTLLSIGLGNLDEAMAHLRDYVTAAQQAERPDLAVQQLRRVARIAKDERFARRVAEFLVELGDARGGAKMLAEAATFVELGAVNPHDRWAAVLRAAQISPSGASVAEGWGEGDGP